MRLSFIALLGAIALFVVSLFLPVFITQNNDVYGYWVLAMGWLGFITFQFAWYASPFAVLAVYVSRKSPQLGLFLSVIAIVMASEAFLFTDIPFGKNDRVLDYGAGFYIWYLCFYLVSFSILFRLVAWGSVEEPIQHEQYSAHHSKNSIVGVTTEDMAENAAQQDALSANALPRAKRKVIPVVTQVQNRPKKQPHKPQWHTATPPPLPKKNIYQALTNAAGRANSEPPPLLPFHIKLTNRAASSTPPPLPKYSQGSQPPPLPERKKWSLKVAPFLEK